MTFYSDGQVTDPSKNDYVIVLTDETHGNAPWRYRYSGTQWEAQYPISNNNYDSLANRPQINEVTLEGNKTAIELGLVGTNEIENLKLDRIYDSLSNETTAHYKLTQSPNGDGSHTTDEYIVLEFDLVSTNFSISSQGGKTLKTYPSVNMTHISGTNVSGFATYYWNETDGVGWWYVATGYNPVSGWIPVEPASQTQTEKLAAYSPEVMFGDTEFSVLVEDTENQVDKRLQQLSVGEGGWTQYVKGDLKVYDREENWTASVFTTSTNGSISVTNDIGVFNSSIFIDNEILEMTFCTNYYNDTILQYSTWSNLVVVTNEELGVVQTLPEFIESLAGEGGGGGGGGGSGNNFEGCWEYKDGTLKHCYYNIGGVTRVANNMTVGEWDNGFLCARFMMGVNGSPSVSTVIYDSIELMYDAQTNMNVYIHPLYLKESDTIIDMRTAPQLQMFEGTFESK